jgi:NTE family protein
VASQITRQRQIHRLRHVIGELHKHVPAERRANPDVRELAAYGCLTRMHVVQLLVPRLDDESHTKDAVFTPAAIRRRWQAGYAATRDALEQMPWNRECDPLDGIVLHEQAGEARLAAE